MYYEINVSKKYGAGRPGYRHFFATAKRSLTSELEMFTVYQELVKAFPTPEYQILITRWEEVGHGVDVKRLCEKYK